METSRAVSPLSTSQQQQQQQQPELETYANLLNNILHSSQSYQHHVSQRSQIEQSCSQLFKQIWTVVNQQQTIAVNDPTTATPVTTPPPPSHQPHQQPHQQYPSQHAQQQQQYVQPTPPPPQPQHRIPLTYTTQLMQFSDKAYQDFVSCSNRTLQLGSRDCLQSYFTQLTNQEQVVYHVMSHLCTIKQEEKNGEENGEEKEVDKTLSLLKTTLQFIQRHNLSNSTSSVALFLQHLAIYISLDWIRSHDDNNNNSDDDGHEQKDCDVNNVNNVQNSNDIVDVNSVLLLDNEFTVIEQQQQQQQREQQASESPSLIDLNNNPFATLDTEENEQVLIANDAEDDNDKKLKNNNKKQKTTTTKLAVNYGPLLSLILEHDAIEYMHVVIQPTIEQVMNHKLLPIVLCDQYLNRYQASSMIKLLNQFPIRDLATCHDDSDDSEFEENDEENDDVERQAEEEQEEKAETEEQRIKTHVLEPVKNALAHLIKHNDSYNLPMLTHLAKLIMCIAIQVPSLSMDCLMALTRAKWPSKMIAHSVLSLFPWRKLSPEMRESCITEMYNVYCRKMDSFSETEHLVHLNDYCNKFLVPYSSIVQNIYQLDAVLAKLNKNVHYPIFLTFARLIETIVGGNGDGDDWHGDNDASQKLATTLIKTLFDFCFKSGTTVSSHLVPLGNIRIEASNQLASLCIQHPSLFSTVMTQIVKCLPQLVQTQPMITEQVCALIQKAVTPQYVVDQSTIDGMRELLSTVKSPTYATDPCIKVVRTLVENIAWKKQAQSHVLATLDLILSGAAVNFDVKQWAIKLLSGPIGQHMTTVSDIELAEDFISGHTETSDEVVASVYLLISLGICNSKLEQADVYEEQYQVWQQSVSSLNILDLLQKSANSPFLGPVLQKYIGCLAAFFGNDVQQFIPAAASAISQYVNDPNRISSVLQVITTCANNKSTKEIEMWSLILYENLFRASNCVILFDQMVKYHYCHKIDMTPIVESIKGKMNPSVSSAQTISNLMNGGQYWTAYAFLCALYLQEPPMVDRTINNATVTQLSTDVECAMWIAVDCAMKTVQNNMHLMSLVFWQHFFTIYFKVEERYGSEMFPRYLRDRYNNHMSNQLSVLPPDHPVTVPLRSLYTWDRTKCNSGEVITDALLKLLDSPNILPPRPPVNNQPVSTPPPPMYMHNTMGGAPVAVPPAARLPPVPSSMSPMMTNSMTMSGPPSSYMTNSMMSSSMMAPPAPVVNVSTPPVTPPIPVVNRPPPPMDSSTMSTQSPAPQATTANVDVLNADIPAMLIAKPVSIPANCFASEHKKYLSIKRMMNDILDNSSESLLELTGDNTNETASEEAVIELCSKMKQSLANYLSIIKKWTDLNMEYYAYTKATYVNVPCSTTLNAVSSRGTPFAVNVPSSTIQLVEPDIINKINTNRQAALALQKTVYEVVDTLSIMATLLNQLSIVMANDSSKHEMGRTVVLELLSYLLDMNNAQKLGAIWSYINRNVAAIGRMTITNAPDMQQPLLDLLISAPALPLAPLQPHILQPAQQQRPDMTQQIASAINSVVTPVMAMLQQKPTTAQPTARPPMPQQQPPLQHAPQQQYQQVPVMSQQMPQAIIQPSLNSERMILFSMFEPNVLLQYGRREEFALLMSIAVETETKLSMEELAYICNRFNLVDFFKELESYPEGKRFTAREDTKSLLRTLKCAMCKPYLQRSFGNRLLRHCARLAFPNETISFLRMVLTLCRSGEYSGNDWPEHLVSQEDLSKLSIDLCISWIATINEYQPLSGACAEGCLNFVYRLVTMTGLASYMDRCDIHDEAVNCIVKFFEGFVSAERADKLPDALFQQMLQMLFSVIKSCPAFVDRLWALYNFSLAPYVSTASPTSIAALTQFMKSVNWSNSVFHIDNMEVLDELFHALFQNVDIVAHVISQLNWNFVMRSETRSPVICKVARIYVALQFFNLGKILPPHITAYFEKLDQYEVPTPVWQQIVPSDFAALFSDRLLFKILVSSKLPTDPAEAYIKIVFWATEIALSLNHTATAEAVASEVRSTMFTILKSAVHGRSWYLDSKQLSNVLMHCLIPLAIKFATNTLIMYVLSTLRECEKGIAPVVIPQNFAFVTGVCPFDQSSPANMRTQEHVKLLDKFKNIIIHFATSANEHLSLTILGCLLLLDLHLDTQVIVLEYTVRSLLKLSTNQHPRHDAANALLLPPHMVLYSSSFNLLLDRCVETYSALALSVLIHKLINVTLQVSGNNVESITNGYIYAMDYILKFVPHPSREDFDIIYLYFMALELIDSQYWDLNNPFVRERNQKFDEVLACLSQKYAKTLTQKLMTSNSSQKLKECKISPATCLAARAVRVYMEDIIQGKQQTVHQLMPTRSSSVYASLTGSNTTVNDYFNYMMKLRGKKEFTSFEPFFNRCGGLLHHIDHEQFRELVALLFPLVPYMHRV